MSRLAAMALALLASCASAHREQTVDAGPQADADTQPSACEVELSHTDLPLLLVIDAADGALLRDVLVNGFVLDVGDRSIPDAANEMAVLRGFDAEHTHYVRVLDDSNGRDVIALTLDLPFGMPVERGARVVLDVKQSGGGFEPERKSLELRRDERLVYYFGRAAMPAELRLPASVTASLGATLCLTRGTCGNYTLHALEVEVEGQAKTLETWRESELGGYRVFHSRSAVQAPGMVRCADWFAADSTLALALLNP